MIIDERRPPLEDNAVRYYGQYVAVAVAETLEQARAAAEAVKVTYDKTAHDTRDKLLGTPLSEPLKKNVTKRGDAVAAFTNSAVKHELSTARRRRPTIRLSCMPQLRFIKMASSLFMRLARRW